MSLFLSCRLEVLFLSGNRLTSIPFEIAQLPNLVSMTLCHNHLSSLPLAVSDMHQLVSLQLHNNRLETLPPGLLQLRQLREISLRCNPLVTRFVREHVDEVSVCWQCMHLHILVLVKRAFVIERQYCPCIYNFFMFCLPVHIANLLPCLAWIRLMLMVNVLAL